MSEAEAVRVNRRSREVGVVTSDKMQKTIVVRVGYKFRSVKYGKVLERFEKFKVHDEKNEAKRGDVVEIEETRPLSKDKRWRLLSIVEKHKADLPEVDVA